MHVAYFFIPLPHKLTDVLSFLATFLPYYYICILAKKIKNRSPDSYYLSHCHSYAEWIYAQNMQMTDFILLLANGL